MTHPQSNHNSFQNNQQSLLTKFLAEGRDRNFYSLHNEVCNDQSKVSTPNHPVHPRKCEPAETHSTNHQKSFP